MGRREKGGRWGRGRRVCCIVNIGKCVSCSRAGRAGQGRQQPNQGRLQLMSSQKPKAKGIMETTTKAKAKSPKRHADKSNSPTTTATGRGERDISARGRHWGGVAHNI